jgi:TctA family transporter
VGTTFVVGLGIGLCLGLVLGVGSGIAAGISMERKRIIRQVDRLFGSGDLRAQERGGTTLAVDSLMTQLGLPPSK